MAKNLLLAILGLALVIETALTVGSFFAPAKTLEVFKVAATVDTYFLVHVIAWCLLFICLICVLAIREIRRDATVGWTLSAILGIWWIGIGAAIYFVFGRPDNLALDSLKGALILLATWKSWPAGGKSGIL